MVTERGEVVGEERKGGEGVGDSSDWHSLFVVIVSGVRKGVSSVFAWGKAVYIQMPKC